MNLYFSDITPYMQSLLQGLWVSVSVTVVSMAVGTILGQVVCIGKVSRLPVISPLCAGYIEVLRNTPLLVQLYILYFGLGQLNLNISPQWATLIGMTLNNGAYTAEILRGGLAAVNKGTVEAAKALGLSPGQSFLHVSFPPMLKSVFPALTNQFILLFLFSSVASIIALPELTYKVLNVSSKTARTFEVFIVAVVFYYACSSIFNILSRYCEKTLFRW
jgi:polar amino acid transport system permease protein